MAGKYTLIMPSCLNMDFSSRLILSLTVFLLILGAGRFCLAQDSWSVAFEGIGTMSSPRCADLNGDGVKDIIIGAGREEFIASDSGMIAVSGADGSLLWNVKSRDQIFGSASLGDIDADGVSDVVLCGRSAELKAISGRDGKVLWEFFKSNNARTPRKRGLYNFYNPQFIPDVDGDGLEDLLVSNGGDVLAEPYDPDRPPGKLMVISSSSGHLIAQDTMPDGKEIYMSVLCFRPNPNLQYQIVFGTGGETIGGNLFVIDLDSLLKGDLSGAQKLASSPDKGFIAPPVAVDLTGDRNLDIVAIGVDASIYAFDSDQFSPLWKTSIEACEAYSSLAVGHFNGDHTPDFFISIAKGVWPKLEWNRQFMINGSNGKIEFIDSLGFYQTSTAVVYDINGDGKDEVILSINYQVLNALNWKSFYNMIGYIDFNTGEYIQLREPFEGSNLASTPWLGDCDDDGRLDIVYVHSTDLRHTYTFDGMQINRIETEIVIHRPVVWGAYMGSSFDGIYSGQKDP